MAPPDAYHANPANGVSATIGEAGSWRYATAGSERQPTILIVDEAEINRRLLRAMLRAEPYEVVEARRAMEALSILEKRPVDLVILDMVMPGISGPEFCRYVKAEHKTRFIPILMLASVQGVENEVAGIASGADEFLIKPLHPEVVRARIRAMLRNKVAIDSLEEAETILFALARSIEHRDHYTAGHCDRLACYSLRLGVALGLPHTELLALYRGGFLHDIGKVAVPDSILYKKEPLTEEEWQVMRTHPAKGEEICKPMKSLGRVLPIIRSHHERWDGGGYPDGLSGEDAPLGARILQVADIYDALTTVRPYKPAFSPLQALDVLSQEAALGWRDPELVTVFRELQRKGEEPGCTQEFSQWAQLAMMDGTLSALPRAAFE